MELRPPTLRSRQSRSARFFLLWVAAPLLLCIGLLIARNPTYYSYACEFQTDYELISLNVENAAHFEAWTGAYSRFQFRHPGPVLFYWYALASEAFPFLDRPLGRYALAQCILNTAFLLIFSYAVFRLFRPRLLGLVAGLILIKLCAGSSGTALTVLSDVWNPFPAIVPMAALLVTSCHVALGRGAFLVPQALSFVVVSQTHLGALPVAVVTLFFSLLLALIRFFANPRRCRLTCKLKWPAVALGILLLAYAPVLYEAYRVPGGGNIGAILRFVSAATWSQDIAHVVTEVSAHYQKIFRPLFIGDGLLILVCLLALMWLPFRACRALRTARLIGICALVMSIYSLLRTQGELYFYLMLYQFGIAAFLCVSAVAALFFILRNKVGIRGQIPRVAIVILIGVLFVSVLSQVTAVVRYRTRCGSHGEAKQFVSFLVPRRHEQFHLQMRDENLLHSMARLALVLRRQGHPICVDRKWWYVFDSSMVCPDAPHVYTPVTLYDLNRGPLPTDVATFKVRKVGISRGKNARAAERRRKIRADNKKGMPVFPASLS